MLLALAWETDAHAVALTRLLAIWRTYFNNFTYHAPILDFIQHVDLYTKAALETSNSKTPATILRKLWLKIWRKLTRHPMYIAFVTEQRISQQN